jgi:LuxR family maltose regulon positive regulatory protein
LERGQAITLRRCLDELPREVVCNRPSLSLAYAWIMTYNEQPETLEKYLVDAEQALGKTGSMATQQISKNENSLRGEIAVLRAQICLAQFDFLCVIAWCRQALQLLPEDNFLIRGWATYYLAHGEKYCGHALEAERAYKEASELGVRADNLFVAVFSQINLAEVQISMGRLREAAETTQLILKVTTEGHQKSWLVIGFAYWGLGILNYEWNDLDTAEHYLRLGTEYGQRSGLISLETISVFSLLLTLQAQGDMRGAEEMLEKIGLMIQQNTHPIYAASFPAFEAHLRWMQKHYEQAFHWADTCELSLDVENLLYVRERDYLTLARIRRTQGKLDGLQEVLAQLSESAEIDQRFGNLFEIRIQQALLQYTLGNIPQALSLLDHVLKMAGPEGYIRTFVDEGEPMHRLLLVYQSTIKKKMTNGVHSTSFELLSYIDKLLAAFPSPALIRRLKHETVLEPISERELEILRLIATGRSNQEIAEILVIALSTVKSHINNLYGKLGTNRRTEAIAIAREMGLLTD